MRRRRNDSRKEKKRNSAKEKGRRKNENRKRKKSKGSKVKSKIHAGHGLLRQHGKEKLFHASSM